MKMQELGTFGQSQIASLLFGGLTNYRIIPAMYVLANRGRLEDKWDSQQQKAMDGLRSLLCATKVFPEGVSHNMVLELVDAHKNLICYTFHDMYYYYISLRDGMPPEPGTDLRMQHYLPAMAEIVNSPFIEWRHGTFDCGVVHPEILDIGCGNSPYYSLFRRDNKGNVWYYGLDKRKSTEYPVHEDGLYRWITMDVHEWLISRAPHILKLKEEITTVFFGNSLHCFKEPVKLLEKVAKLPKVSKIMVVEFAPESALNFMFDFHMYLHAGTSVRTTPIPLESWKCEGSRPTTQHAIHTYTKR